MSEGRPFRFFTFWDRLSMSRREYGLPPQYIYIERGGGGIYQVLSRTCMFFRI